MPRIDGEFGSGKPKISLREEYPIHEVPNEDARKATQLPTPSGYRILCAVPEVEREFESGIQKADITIQNEELLTTVLFVVAMGPDCYGDKNRFPSGPWCKTGDFVLVRPHAGTRVLIHGKQFRIINDDCVEGVVEDPRGYSRG
jgi:co-chaperonin GroES (HSP10)